jgi:hypothetical protein
MRLVPPALIAATKVGWPLLVPSVARSGGRGGEISTKVRPPMLAAASAAAPIAKLRQKARLRHKLSRGCEGLGMRTARAMRDQARSGGATGATASASTPSRSSQKATSEAKA